MHGRKSTGKKDVVGCRLEGSAIEQILLLARKLRVTKSEMLRKLIRLGMTMVTVSRQAGPQA